VAAVAEAIAAAVAPQNPIKTRQSSALVVMDAVVTVPPLGSIVLELDASNAIVPVVSLHAVI
jgi:hypothetical protein